MFSRLLTVTTILLAVCGGHSAAADDANTTFVTYIDKLTSWWPPADVAAGLGVPGYTKVPMNYTVVNLSFWTTSGPTDAALVWSDLYKYMSAQNPWGNSTSAIQQALLERYHAAGVKVLVSAFGATEFPTSGNADPVDTARSLAEFVLSNHLDGVDLDYEDNTAMNAGKGEQWLIACTTELRQLLPRPLLITHAPQAPYFMGKPQYPAGGYLTVDSSVGHMVDFYNIQFYNQGTSEYATYATLFQSSDGWATHTSLSQLLAAGIPLSRMVVGKPATKADVVNTGYVDLNTLEGILAQGVAAGTRPRGVMNWQYSSDVTTLDGAWVPTLSKAFA